jgi:alkylhydroperoxidase family enzyme
MTRISKVIYEEALPEIQEAYNNVVASHGSVSNMKATLLHSPAALRAVLEWYTLFGKVQPVLDKRLSILFCNAISRENACTLCATYMQKEIVDAGEDPERLQLDDRDRTIIEFGRQLAADPNRISDDLFARLRSYLTETQVVELTVFGALMIVNNVVNSALRVEVDEGLSAYIIQPEIAFAGSSHFLNDREAV